MRTQRSLILLVSKSSRRLWLGLGAPITIVSLGVAVVISRHGRLLLAWWGVPIVPPRRTARLGELLPLVHGGWGSVSGLDDIAQGWLAGRTSQSKETSVRTAGRACRATSLQSDRNASQSWIRDGLKEAERA
jgi:hypothetical protein